jgi:hypothetical protein
MRQLIPVLVAALASGGIACTPTRGEIMLVVTTDLVVPTDLDWLDWSVTIDGDETPYQNGTTNLRESGLPATLGIVSGPDTHRSRQRPGGALGEVSRAGRRRSRASNAARLPV